MGDDIEALAEKAQNLVDYEAASNPTIRRILTIVKQFIQRSRVMCYGGTAINNLLPPKERFYDPNYDIPDYDFYSETPQIHAMQLADQFQSLGFTSIEVRPGAHLQTYKVFVNYTGVADITYLEPPIFKSLWKENIVVDKIHYVTPNFLRMSMYLELSRPRGEVSRWSKVYKRLMLLNQQYPVGCAAKSEKHEESDELSEDSFSQVETMLRTKQIILLGLHAAKLHDRVKLTSWELPVDVLVTPENFDAYTEEFASIFEGKAKVTVMEPYSELLPKHADITDKHSGHLIIRVFETMACHSFHEMKNGIRVASIPTLLQFFFAFVYADAHYLEGYDQDRIICIAQRLVDIAHKEKERRFELLTPLECLGHQETLPEMKAHTGELKSKINRDSKDFLWYFFTYDPSKYTKTQKQALRKKLKKTSKRRL